MRTLKNPSSTDRCPKMPKKNKKTVAKICRSEKFSPAAAPTLTLAWPVHLPTQKTDVPASVVALEIVVALETVLALEIGGAL